MTRGVVAARGAIAAAVLLAIGEARAQAPIYPPPAAQAPVQPPSATLSGPATQPSGPISAGQPAQPRQAAPGAAPGEPAPGTTRTFVPSLGVTERITDNVRLLPQGRTDEITTLSPALSVRYQGPRSYLNLDGTLNVDRYAETPSLDRLRTSLIGNGQAQLIRDYASVDLQTFATQQQTNRVFAAQPDVANGAPGQQDVYGFTLSPFLEHRFGSVATTELRYRYGQTFVSTSGSANPTPAIAAQPTVSGIPSSTYQQLSSFAETGPAFTRLLSRLSASAGTTALPLGDLNQRNVGLESQYVVSRPISLLSNIGYDDIHVPLQTQPLSGPYALGGVQLTPGPRSRMRVEMGERYRSFSIIGEGTYKIGPTSTARVLYTDTISSQPTQFLTNLESISQDPLGNFVDSETGLVYTPREQAAINLTAQPFRQHRLVVVVPFVDERNTYTLTGSQTIRHFLSPPAVGQPVQGDQIASAVVLTVARQITRATTATASASYSTSSIGGQAGSTIETFRLQLGLNYRYSEATTFQAIYSYLDQTNGTVGAAPTLAQFGPVQENSILVGVRRAF